MLRSGDADIVNVVRKTHGREVDRPWRQCRLRVVALALGKQQRKVIYKTERPIFIDTPIPVENETVFAPPDNIMFQVRDSVVFTERQFRNKVLNLFAKRLLRIWL